MGRNLEQVTEDAARVLADQRRNAVPIAERYSLDIENETHIGDLKVSAVGVEYFSGGKPCSVQARGPVNMLSLVDSLINHTARFWPAYWAVLPCGSEVQLSTYWSRDFYGDAPELNVGEVVEVYGRLNPKTGKALFTYRKPAKV